MNIVLLWKFTIKSHTGACSQEYLIPFFRGIGLSRYVTRMVNIKPALRPIASLACMINDLRKIITHVIKYRRRAFTELVAASEMQLFVSSLGASFLFVEEWLFATVSLL
jgi:hypothetical protein